MASRIAVMGATGYTALELLKLLVRHPEAEIVSLTTRQENRPHVSDVHPELRGRLDLHLETLDLEKLAAEVDVVFSCLPHAASAESVKPLVDQGVKVVDFSADYRLHDRNTYEQWYGTEHVDPERIGTITVQEHSIHRDGNGLDELLDPVRTGRIAHLLAKQRFELVLAPDADDRTRTGSDKLQPGTRGLLDLAGPLEGDRTSEHREGILAGITKLGKRVQSDGIATVHDVLPDLEASARGLGEFQP